MEYVRTTTQLAALVETLRGSPLLAIDTEFVRERQYYPQLEIVQVATPEVEAILDFRALGTLEPFTELLDDPATRKIFHAGGQDLEIFFNAMGRVPVSLFDTQVAAAIIGFGAQIGYARLVEEVLGVSLAKKETLTDWSRRPLSPAQLEYALDDVRYMLPLYHRLQVKLAEAGRSNWLDEEWAAMEDPDGYRRTPPNEAYHRVSGGSRLKPRELAVLRELAEWRETEAIRRDRAAPLIVRDNILLELVRRTPTTLDELREIRDLHAREIERGGREMLDAIARGQALPRSEWPTLTNRASLNEQESSLVTLMQSWLRARADEVEIAASYLATSAELQALVRATPGERRGLPLARGWRWELVGRDLLALVEGRAALTWEADHQRVRLIRLEEEGAG